MKRKLTEDEMRDYLRSQCGEHGQQKVLAKRLKISRSYLCDVLQGKRGIAATIAEALGYRMEVKFIRNL